MLLVTRRNINSLIACFFLTLLSTVLILIQSATVCGQGNGTASTGTGGSHLISGKIYFPSGRRAEGVIQVKLESFSAGEITTLADANGAFTFASLSPGNYTVVVNAEGYEIAREGVTIDSDLNLSRAGISVNTPQRRYTVIVNLQPKRGSENQAGAAVINAALAEVPEAARNLYEKALQLEQSNNIANAIDNLKAAISLYPKFPQALNELGVQYLKLGQPYKAVEPLRAASKLTPEAPLPKLNLGIALLETRQFTEAETQLREVLKRFPQRICTWGLRRSNFVITRKPRKSCGGRSNSEVIRSCWRITTLAVFTGKRAIIAVPWMSWRLIFVYRLMLQMPNASKRRLRISVQKSSSGA